MSEFEGDCGSAEEFEGVETVRLGGVDDGNGFGQAGLEVGEVMVGDDEVETEMSGLVCGGEGPDAGVDGDDQADAGGGGLGETGRLHSVALPDAVGDMPGDERMCGARRRGDAIDRGLQENGRSGSVDIVVTVDENGFPGGHGLLYAGNGAVDAQHELGGMEVIECGVEEGIRLRGGAGAAGDEEVGNCVRAEEVGGEIADEYRVGGTGLERGCFYCFHFSASASRCCGSQDSSESSTTKPPSSETVSIRFWKRSYHSVAVSKRNMTPWWAKPSWR